jgi:predicted HAD superfamily phosphohydrolase
MIKRISGKPKMEWYAKDASVAFPNLGLVYWNGSGELIPADATSGDHAGIILRAVTSADADYATALAKVPVDLITAEDVLEADVGTGTLTTAMVGNHYDLTAAGDAIDVSAQSKKVVLVVGFVSATKALIKLNALAVYKDVATT